jgi:cytochrome c biogenesis protein CcmG/thiol:disulfide interchange protein DsbE
MRSLRFILPLLVFVAIGVFLLKGLSRDPREIPSPLIDRAAPAFELPTLGDAQRTWTPQAMRGQVWLLNVWGSWCVACQVEHPLLNRLAKDKVLPIVGLAWKDMPENSRAWLARMGDPYGVVVMDFAGKVAIDYGVYGAPETFLIDKAGTIRFKHVGPITPELLEAKLLPLVRRLQAS